VPLNLAIVSLASRLDAGLTDVEVPSEDAFTTARAEGRVLPLDEAVAVVLEQASATT
jgi:hypothetical protein